MATFENSAEANLNPSISSAAGIPASRSAKPESEQAPKTPGIFGQSSLDCFAFLDPDTRSWKTSQGTFLWDSGTYSETWPNSGTMRSGRVYALRTSGPATCERECSSWPTATAKDTGRSGETVAIGNASRSREKIASLSIEAQLWPTARREDGESCGNHPGAMDSLTGAAKLWPTAQSHDCHGEKTPEQIERQRNETGAGVRNLNEEASTWRTPDAPGTGGPRNRKGSTGEGHQVTIAEQAERWPTPQAFDASNCQKGPAAEEYDRHRRAMGGNGGPSKNLREFVTHSLPAPATEDGPPSCESAPTSRQPSVSAKKTASESTGNGSPPGARLLRRRLNPRFVSWLMGFPATWTEL